MIFQVRRTEILYVLVIDMTYFGDFPNALGVAGYIIVFASVVGMSAAANIENGIKNILKLSTKRNENIVV